MKEYIVTMRDGSIFNLMTDYYEISKYGIFFYLNNRAICFISERYINYIQECINDKLGDEIFI